jgi:hypothetical protein
MRTLTAAGLIHLALACVSWSLTPSEIIENVEATYLNLNSISFDSTIVSESDDGGGGKPHRTVSTCKVRLARPMFYRLEWKKPVTRSYVNEGAAWSSGVRHYFFSNATGKVSEKNNIDLAFASVTGGGAGQSIPSLFFQRPGSVLRHMKNATLLPDEKVGGLDCYVVSGNTSSGAEITLWITKDFLLVQKRETLGEHLKAEVREKAAAALEKSLERFQPSSTPETAAQIKQRRETTRESVMRMKTSTTETMESIELNPSFEQALFETKDVNVPSLPR